MGKLVYAMITSLDGYVADAEGNFDFAAPDDAFNTFLLKTAAPLGTYLYGRRMYETMVFWETAHTLPDAPSFVLEWARIWQAADKVVYSTTLEAVASARTRQERAFDASAILELKQGDSDVEVSGPGLAAAALRAGLVDEIGQYIAPVIVGGGTPFLPAGLKLDLQLLDERNFDNGVVYVNYAVKS